MRLWHHSASPHRYVNFMTHVEKRSHAKIYSKIIGEQNLFSFEAGVFIGHSVKITKIIVSKF